MAINTSISTPSSSPFRDYKPVASAHTRARQRSFVDDQVEDQLHLVMKSGAITAGGGSG
jgi:hypothetical protein